MKRGEVKHEPARLYGSLTSEQRKKLSSMHSEKLAIKVANIDVSKGPESSLTVSTPSDDETKKPKESPWACLYLSSFGRRWLYPNNGRRGTRTPDIYFVRVAL